MKKVLVAVVLMMGIGSFSAFAAETSVDSVVIACEVNQDDFVKVEVKDLPGVVTQSIEKSYPDSVIQEVYVAEKTEGKLFKVILVIEGKEAIAIFNEKGEEFILEGEELLARAFCHEIDHLGGHLYVEKVEGELHDSPAYNEEDMEYEVEE